MKALFDFIKLIRAEEENGRSRLPDHSLGWICGRAYADPSIESHEYKVIDEIDVAIRYGDQFPLGNFNNSNWS